MLRKLDIDEWLRCNLELRWQIPLMHTWHRLELYKLDHLDGVGALRLDLLATGVVAASARHDCGGRKREARGRGDEPPPSLGHPSHR